MGSTPAARTILFSVKNLNKFGVIRFLNRLPYVVGNWVQSPFKPEQKPEHGGGTDGNGEKTVWLGI
ncbi:MAG: hypothetical protein WBN22_09985 [Verrucomicrobiia bacterium]